MRTRPSANTIVVALVLASVVVCPGVSVGAVVLSFNNSGSTTLHEISVEPGDAFTVDVMLSTESQMFFVECNASASESGIFHIDQNAAMLPWLSQGTGGLEPELSNMSWGLPFPDYFGPGTTMLGTLQLTVGPTAAFGTYTLSPSAIAVWDHRAVPGTIGGLAGPSFIVHVVPEPSSFVMVFIFALVLYRRWF